MFPAFRSNELRLAFLILWKSFICWGLNFQICNLGRSMGKPDTMSNHWKNGERWNWDKANNHNCSACLATSSPNSTQPCWKGPQMHICTILWPLRCQRVLHAPFEHSFAFEIQKCIPRQLKSQASEFCTKTDIYRCGIPEYCPALSSESIFGMEHWTAESAPVVAAPSAGVPCSGRASGATDRCVRLLS